MFAKMPYMNGCEVHTVNNIANTFVQNDVAKENKKEKENAK